MKSLYQHIYENNFCKSEISEKLLINKNLNTPNTEIDIAIKKYLKGHFIDPYKCLWDDWNKYEIWNFWSPSHQVFRDYTELDMDGKVNYVFKDIIKRMLEESNNCIYVFSYDFNDDYGLKKDYMFVERFLNAINNYDYYDILFEEKMHLGDFSIKMYESSEYIFIKMGIDTTGKIIICEKTK